MRDWLPASPISVATQEEIAVLNGLPFLSPEDLSGQGIEPTAPAASPALQEDSLLLSHWVNHMYHYRYRVFYFQDIKDKQTIIL